ncbi:hypothetical protein DKT77_09060 [Meridianimarinicoccus roseus]|jgi:uncharacterized protein (UPF0262 family)|uniref:Uncharacterized protein n=1 Tax=Meridianimarinicoccus roseus TaxID=2072018 RepID=A0A2V2LDD4_9RHOB|nr:UPF0262 family protein [Meridianimarinicoccus roseus]PWR03072.1 hypothetical protein DKT77_09060 [Meridianimarinicoccus roseus]
MTARLCAVTLEPGDGRAPSPEAAQEQNVAIFDLLEENHFSIPGAPQGPYLLTLGLTGSRLAFDLRCEDGTAAARFTVTLGELRQIVKDYEGICASYYEAVRSKPPAEIEKLDEARRAIHHEGADTLRALLDGHAELDDDTARRLFTLVCALTDSA